MPKPVAAGREGTAGKTGKRVARGKGKQVAEGKTTEKLKRKEQKEGEYLLSCSENDNLHVIFDEWAKKHDKNYSCDGERNERFNIFCASKKLVDEHNSLNPGSTSLVLGYFADSQIQCGGKLNTTCFASLCLCLFINKRLIDCAWTNEEEELNEEASNEAKEGQDILSCSENDKLLRAVFDKWAEKLNKTYSSERQREERFQIFCASKKLVDKHNSLNLGYKLDLFWFSDMKVQCGASRVRCTLKCWRQIGGMEEGGENLNRLKCDLPTLFEKWQKKYRIEYSSEEERNKRFRFFCATKKSIDKWNSREPGSYGHTRYDDRPRFRPSGRRPPYYSR